MNRRRFFQAAIWMAVPGALAVCAAEGETTLADGESDDPLVKFKGATDGYELMLGPASEEHPRYGEGSVIELASGDLLIAYSEFYTRDQGDFGAAHVLGRRSTDRGRTWGEPFQLAENDALTVFSASLARLPSGRLLLAYLRKLAVDRKKVAKGANCIPWFRSSDDEGKTWGAPWRMDAPQEQDYLNLNNDRLVVHSSGRLIAPVAVMEPRGSEDPYHCASTCFYSDDEGRTWKRSATSLQLDAMDGLQEPGVVELRDGALMMLMRTSLGHQYRSVSDDRAHTWSPAEPVPELISPVSPVSVKRIPSTGHLLAIFNKTYDPIGCPGPCAMGWRTPLTAAVSLDDGKTWSLLRNIENDPQLAFDYVSITFLEGDEVLFTYHLTEYFGSRVKWHRNLKLKILPVRWFYESAGTGRTHIPAFKSP